MVIFVYSFKRERERERLKLTSRIIHNQGMSWQFQKRWTERVTLTQRQIFFVISSSQVDSQHKLTILLSCSIIGGVRRVREVYIKRTFYCPSELVPWTSSTWGRRFCKILRFLSFWTFFFFFISTYYYKILSNHHAIVENPPKSGPFVLFLCIFGAEKVTLFHIYIVAIRNSITCRIWLCISVTSDCPTLKK